MLSLEPKGRSVAQAWTLCGLGLVGLLAIACSPASNSDDGSGSGSGGTAPARAGSGGSSSTGTGGSSGTGTGGSSSTGTGGSSSSGSGGSSGSSSGGAGGDSSGSGGSSASGGSGGAAGGGSGGMSGGDAAAPMGTGDGGPSAGHTPNPKNPCFTEAIPNRVLAGLSAADFCDGYEKFCLYTPDGMMMSKCAPGQPVGPLYKDRMDCETKYMAASAGARACRAGQMCRNGKDGQAMAGTPKGASLIVNACSHATGYCAGTCK